MASPNRTYKQRKRRRTKRNALTVWLCVEKYQRRKRKDTWWHRSEREESYGRQPASERERGKRRFTLTCRFRFAFFLFDSVQVNRENNNNNNNSKDLKERIREWGRGKIYSSWINIYRDSETQFVPCVAVQCNGIAGIEPFLLSIGIGFVCRAEEVIRSLVFF